MSSFITHLQTDLLAWFNQQARDLPWRLGQTGQRDPYRVWVAEILLQQTQVSRGKIYYQRFLDAFPDVHHLAKAPQDAVLKAWEGCGYYARARNLHKAADIVSKTGFPETYEAWLKLPGVGPYTAAAIASLAFNEARAVNDGNVRRVLSRLFAEKQPSEVWVQEKANQLLHPERPGDWNESMMDLGATICTPKSPQCHLCPINKHCQAFKIQAPNDYPAPKARAKVQKINAVALIIGNQQKAFLEKRTGKLLGGLLGLPTELIKDCESPNKALSRLAERLNIQINHSIGTVTHTMTHRHITLHVFTAQGEVPLIKVTEAALSRLDHKALELFERRKGLFEESSI